MNEIKVLFKQNEYEAGINADGELYFCNQDSGYNLEDIPEHRSYIEADIRKYTGKIVNLQN